MIILDEMQREQLDFRFASFGGRFMAYLIDAILLLLFRWLVALLFGVPFRDTESGILWFGNLFGLLYFILLESGASQATIGKQLMHIKVVDEQGHRINVGTSVIRNLSKILSAFLLLIGFLLVLFNSKRRALHDIIARTYVVEDQ
jgi:uncharacterized RDD family membrane protein YckC